MSAGDSTPPPSLSRRRAVDSCFTLAELGRDESRTFTRNGDRARESAERAIVGRSPALLAVLRQLQSAAATQATVLIFGETGTGKELAAQALHRASPRRDRPLTIINCGALPADLLEQDLFGVERGAVPGVSRTSGRFELADRGTLLLDEVAEFPAALQGKLVRAIQDHAFERIGSTETRRVDVRFAATTTRDLRQLVADGKFRGDLFYRLNVFPLRLPPLRERREDIPLLVEYFAKRFSRQLGKRVETATPATLAALQSHDWPGNVRELQNVVERAVILCPGSHFTVDAVEFGRASASPDAHSPCLPGRTLRDCERRCILDALQLTQGMVGGPRGAAAMLDVKRTTLIGKMEKLGITRRQGVPQPSANAATTPLVPLPEPRG